jgi:hypothetical protein
MKRQPQLEEVSIRCGNRDTNRGDKMKLTLSRVARGIAFLFVTIACHRSLVQSLRAQPTLRITSPADGTVVSPGHLLAVTVEASPDRAFQEIIIVGGSPIGFSQVLTTPPYRFSILIPRDIIPRRYTITADGTITPGHSASSEPVTIAVERPETPLTLKAEPSVLAFDFVGDNTWLQIIGVFDKEEHVYLDESGYIKFVSDNPTVATVDRTGRVTAIGNGSARITVTYRAKSVVVPVTVRLSKPAPR